jgi:Nitroreductase family
MSSLGNKIKPAVPLSHNSASTSITSSETDRQPSCKKHFSISDQLHTQSQVTLGNNMGVARTLVPASAQPFLDAMAGRRSYYVLSKSSPIPDARIQEIIKHALLHVPSSFNSQTTRIVLLLGEEHDKLWEITKEILRDIVPAESFSTTEKKLNGFKAGHGTVGSALLPLGDQIRKKESHNHTT